MRGAYWRHFKRYLHSFPNTFTVSQPSVGTASAPREEGHTIQKAFTKGVEALETSENEKLH